MRKRHYSPMAVLQLKKTIIVHCCLIICIMFLLVNTAEAYAEGKMLPSGITEQELDSEIDKYVAENLDTTAGMAYSVFSCDQEIASGYYGYADKEHGIEVDENTVFEWGSASKLMVWVSVMQLSEQGKIDSEENILHYMPDDILHNLNYETPITMIDLMNHSAGFQEDYTDLFVKQSHVYTNLEEALLAHQPEQIFEPGELVAYSNWSTALAAYIVEQVTGMEYVDYVHTYIFEPLKMEHSAIAMDLSDNEWVAEKRKELASYDTTGNRLSDSFYYISLYPVGMCTSTLTDFKTFAQSLMDKDTILFKNSDTWREMFTPTRYYQGTKTGRNYHGMWMIPLGVPTIGHGGNTAGCSSYLLMDVENDIGAVVMTNQSNESTYNIHMMNLIYGAYGDKKYDVDKGDPQGIFKPARTFNIGPLKLLTLTYNGDLNEDDVFFVYSDDNSSRTIEYPYGDYYGIMTLEMIVELAILGAFLISFVISLGIMITRFIRRTIRKYKKIPQNEGTIWPDLSFAMVITTLILLSYAFISISHYELAIRYQWAFAVVGIIGILLIILAPIGYIKTILLNENKIYKAANIVLITNSLLLVVNVAYWNLFMFWAL